MEELPPQFEIFKDCLTRRTTAQSSSLDPSSTEDDGSELSDFSSYLAREMWPALPLSFHSASYEIRSSLPDPDADLDSDSLLFSNIPT